MFMFMQLTVALADCSDVLPFSSVSIKELHLTRPR